MQQPNVDWSSDLSFVYFWVCVKVIQGTEKLRTTQEHYMYSVSQAGWSCEHLEFELAVECLNPVGTFMWNELGKPHMHLTPSFTCLVRLPGFLLYIFLSSLWQYNKWKRTWNRPVCLYMWISNTCSYIVGYTFTYFSAGVVVSVAGVLMFIITALIIVSCVVMKRKQAFNITSEWIKLVLALYIAWIYDQSTCTANLDTCIRNVCSY